MIQQEELWFSTPDTNTLCRNGGNGPNHLSQLYAIRKYVKPGMSLLDYGCGSGTTWEAIKKAGLDILYTGTDIIEKNIAWDRENFPEVHFIVNTDPNRISQPDKMVDVVFSRHVVDHMASFEDALDEHCRVAKKLVIIILWIPFQDGEEHKLSNIKEGEKTYANEYFNSYSRSKVMKKIKDMEPQGWKLVELTEEIPNGSQEQAAQHDIAIVLERE